MEPRNPYKFKVPTLWDEAEGNTAWLDIARDRQTLRGRRPCARAETLHAGAGRAHVCLGLEVSRRPHWEVLGHKPMTYEHGQSDNSIVPGKLPNKAVEAA